jgi:hypothetical protein
LRKIWGALVRNPLNRTNRRRMTSLFYISHKYTLHLITKWIETVI